MGSAAGINFGATYIGQDTAESLSTETKAGNAFTGSAVGDVVSGARAGGKSDYSFKANTEISGIRLGTA